MDRTAYMQEAKRQLSSKEFYQLLTEDCMAQYQKELNKTLKEVLSQNTGDDYCYLLGAQAR